MLCVGDFECHSKVVALFTVHAFHSVVSFRGSLGNETDARFHRFRQTRGDVLRAHAKRFKLCV